MDLSLSLSSSEWFFPLESFLRISTCIIGKDNCQDRDLETEEADLKAKLKAELKVDFKADLKDDGVEMSGYQFEPYLNNSAFVLAF